MNDVVQRCAVGLLALGLTAGLGVAAAAQEVDEDGYVIEVPAPPIAEIDDEDDDEEEITLANRDGMQRCAETFRSFDPQTGTYVTYQGETRFCPYLE